VNINNERNLLNKKIVYDVTKFTTTDYKDHLSCIVWFIGCNMHCSYCYNSDIVLSKKANHSFEEVIGFLKTRVNLLDAVVLSGGEATLHNLVLYCTLIKALGFKIKLDTNGLNTLLIKELVNKELVDYIALDFKATQQKFQQITKTSRYNDFFQTLEFLVMSNVDFEVRTTLHANLLNENDINIMMKHLKKVGYEGTFYIQNFLYTPDNLGKLKEPTALFDSTKLDNTLEIVFR